MTSFLEKLKKGMGNEVVITKNFTEEKTEKEPKDEVMEKPAEKLKEKKAKPRKKPRTKITSRTKSKKPEEIIQESTPVKEKILPPEKEIAEKEKPVKKKTIILTEQPLQEEKTPEQKQEKTEAKERNWFEPEGELTVDVYQTDGELVIRSAIAGINAEELEISIENDIITIRGRRKEPAEAKKSYFFQECYWGPFSRQIILPAEVDCSRAEASMKRGILTLRMPVIERERRKEVKVKMG